MTREVQNIQNFSIDFMHFAVADPVGMVCKLFCIIEIQTQTDISINITVSNKGDCLQMFSKLLCRIEIFP